MVDASSAAAHLQVLLQLVVLFYPAFYKGIVNLIVRFTALILFQLAHFANQYKGDTFRNDQLNKVLMTIGLITSFLALVLFIAIATGVAALLFLMI
jgi:hypothetical protein